MERSTNTETGPERAAYGFRVAGIDGNGLLALRGAGSWPLVQVETRIESELGPRSVRITEREAFIRTPVARLTVDRATRRLTVAAPRPLPVADLAHPCLWPAAAVLARWRGAETLHAGAVVDGAGGAWAILGDRGAGKSTVLAAVALTGHPVVADDLLVVEGRECFAGPRCIDLRRQSASGS